MARRGWRTSLPSVFNALITLCYGRGTKRAHIALDQIQVLAGSYHRKTFGKAMPAPGQHVFMGAYIRDN